MTYQKRLMGVGIAAVALLLGFVLMTAVFSIDEADAATEGKGVKKKINVISGTSAKATSSNETKTQVEKDTATNQTANGATGGDQDSSRRSGSLSEDREVQTRGFEIEISGRSSKESSKGQLPTLSLSDAEAIVKKAFPDSKINSNVRKNIAIIVKDRAGSEARTNNTLPAYVFQLTKTDDKAIYQITAVVDGTSGQIIPPYKFLNNDGICGPHTHPPGMGTHWHVCSIDENVWRWDPPPTAKIKNPDKKGGGKPTLTGIPSVDGGTYKKSNDGDPQDKTEGKPIEEQVTIKQKSSNVKEK
ncbi:MAG: hypothetical protein QW177_09985 [Candidatus Nitrosotenuis sp.]